MTRRKISNQFKSNLGQRANRGVNDTLDQLEALRRERDELRSALANARPPEPTLLSLADLRTDGGTQPRTGMDTDLLSEYAERMTQRADGVIVDLAGQVIPSITVFSRDGELWLADGFHRVTTARAQGWTHFQAEVLDGGQREAFLHSLQANATHGKRRTNADKRRAVERALLDPALVTFTDTHLASICKVSRPLVTRIRAELERTAQIEYQETLYDHRGEAHENMRDAPEPVVAVQASIRRKPAPRKKAPVARDAVGLLIAHPTDEASIDALVAEAASLTERARLVVLFPQGSRLFARCAALADALSEHGFDWPQSVYIASHQRSYLVFGRGCPALPLHLSDPAGLKCAPQDGHAVLGTALDSWSALTTPPSRARAT